MFDIQCRWSWPRWRLTSKPGGSSRYFTCASLSVIFCGFDERHFRDALFFQEIHLAETGCRHCLWAMSPTNGDIFS
jgi:hypothetical protein